MLLAAVLVAGACGGSATERPGGRPEASPTDFVSGGVCTPDPEGALPAEKAGCVTRAEGDADGDGSIDTLTVYARLNKKLLPVSWRVRLDGASNDFVQPLEAGNKFSYPRAVGAVDVDGDGRDEWVIKVFDLAGHGAVWQRLNLFTVRGRSLEAVTYEDEPLAVDVGGISRMGQGVECRDDHLVLLRAEARNRRNTRWEFSARAFGIDGRRARFVRRQEGTLRIEDYNDPALDRFFALDCKALHYTP